MAMRMTGMMSGMDTESIIQELVAARQKKVDVKKKEQIRIDWKQEAWKDLNTKLKNLQTKFISNMRFSTSYSKKTSKISDSTKVSVITGESAVNGVQSLKIEKLAQTGYLTGREIGLNEKAKKDGTQLNALTKLGELTGGESLAEGTFSVKTASGTVDIKIDGNTTISDVLTQLKSAGLNASFDEKWGRFNISSSKSGEKNDFSITALDPNGNAALKVLGINTKLSDDAATSKEYTEYAAYYTANGGDKTATIAAMKDMIDADIASRGDAYLQSYNSLQESIASAQKAINDINAEYASKLNYDETSISSYEKELEDKTKEIEDFQKANPDDAAGLKALHEESEAIRKKIADAKNLAAQNKNVEDYNKEIDKIKEYIDTDGTATNKLTTEVEDRYYNKAMQAAQALEDAKTDKGPFATKTSGQDAVIELNGAEYKHENNTFEINGLTFTALSETKEGETVTVTTEQDTDGIYDMIKNFLKEYNSIVNEMDKLYNADRAKGYEPLTDEEKDAMSEKEVEKWETKIKDSILRRDDNLSTVNSALQSIMSAGVEVNGKTMYLFDFGIDTLGYFAAADNEKHAYHIDGDPDDEFTSGNADKLKSMIANDPDTVISFFTKLSSNLYDKMFDMSKSVNGYRSFGNFYDDKKMKSDYDSYTSKIKEMETKLAEYEDKWYRKFSKMETALAKMQSNMSAVSGLLGG